MPNIKIGKKGWISFVVDNFSSCSVTRSAQVDGNIHLGKGEVKGKKLNTRLSIIQKNRNLKFTQQSS